MRNLVKLSWSGCSASPAPRNKEPENVQLFTRENITVPRMTHPCNVTPVSWIEKVAILLCCALRYSTLRLTVATRIARPQQLLDGSCTRMLRPAEYLQILASLSWKYWEAHAPDQSHYLLLGVQVAEFCLSLESLSYVLQSLRPKVLRKNGRDVGGLGRVSIDPPATRSWS